MKNNSFIGNVIDLIKAILYLLLLGIVIFEKFINGIQPDNFTMLVLILGYVHYKSKD